MRVIIRFSIDGETNGVVRKALADRLTNVGIKNTRTGTWEHPDIPAANLALAMNGSGRWLLPPRLYQVHRKACPSITYGCTPILLILKPNPTSGRLEHNRRMDTQACGPRRACHRAIQEGQ